MREKEYLLSFYDLAEPRAVKALSNALTAFGERAELEAIGPDHYILIVWAGVPEERVA
jgi:hypothetical protein